LGRYPYPSGTVEADCFASEATVRMQPMASSPWHTSPLPYDTVRKLSRALGLSEITAAVLARRGYAEPEAASRFLAEGGTLHDPFLFPGMAGACRRLHQAFDKGEKICIHGDYDVDGITSTALLARVFRELGGEVSCHIPNRFRDGYGVTADAVRKIAGDGATLLVTVDCGISSRDELEEAGELGLDTIVVDHHRPLEGTVPPGLIISPLLCDYPFKELAGVGLAFKLAQALTAWPDGRGEDDAREDSGGMHPLLQRQLDLVALGTIADVVPLLDENRILVKRGLVQMARTRTPGIKALMRAGQVEPSRLNAGLVAFRMAPRINAAGRLGDAGKALALMLADTDDEANGLADSLNTLNRQRQSMENQILAEALDMVRHWPEEEQQWRGYVLSSPGWHEGVIGIVASRLVERFHRPVIMIAEDGEGDGRAMGKGSGRSIPAFDLHAALGSLDELLAGYGGHRAACGLTIDLQRLDEFRRAFASLAETTLDDEDMRPSRYVDALVLGRELTLDLADELSNLEPFGMGNPSVELLVSGARIEDGRRTRDGQHLQCRVDAGGASAKAIGFGQAHLLEKLEPGNNWDVVFRLERNEFNGSVSPQMSLRAVFPGNSEGNGEEVSNPGGCRGCCTPLCPDRVQGEGFRSMLAHGAPLPAAWLDPDGEWRRDIGKGVIDGLKERTVDRRGYGAVPQQIARLAATGERVLLLVADVARRRDLLFSQLSLPGSANIGRLPAGVRCGRDIITDRLGVLSDGTGAKAVMMADFSTAAATRGLTGAFDHLVFVDPPVSPAVMASLAASAPEAWIHLIYCSDEVQFTQRVLGHEYDLREPVAGVYRRLKPERALPLDKTAERLLLAGGKYLRNPEMVVRCLTVLRELGLVSLEDSGEEPILTMPEVEKTELERSPTFVQHQRFHETCQKHLNRLQKTMAA